MELCDLGLRSVWFARDTHSRYGLILPVPTRPPVPGIRQLIMRAPPQRSLDGIKVSGPVPSFVPTCVPYVKDDSRKMEAVWVGGSGKLRTG